MRTHRLKEAANNAKQVHRSGIDSTVTVAAFTALAYAVAYQYESGYCSHFRIPTQLISPTASVLVAALLGLMVSAVTFAPAVGLLRHLLSNAGFTELARLRVEVAALFSLVLLATLGLTWVAALGALAVFLIGCGEYLPVFWRKGSLRERFEAIERTPDPANDFNPVFMAMKETKDRRVFKFFILAWLSVYTAHGAGTFNARNQAEFQVITSRPDVAFVRSYDDLLIGVKFDERKKAATGEVVVFKVSDDFKELHVSPKRIGPLAKSEVPE